MVADVVCGRGACCPKAPSFLTTIASRGAASILGALTTFDCSGSEPIGARCFFLAREASHRARRGAPIPFIDVHTGAKAARRAAGRSRVDNHLPRAAANSSPFRPRGNCARLRGGCRGQGRISGTFLLGFSGTAIRGSGVTNTPCAGSSVPSVRGAACTWRRAIPRTRRRIQSQALSS